MYIKTNTCMILHHWMPKQDIIRETLEWMDKYFGPVK